MSIIADLYNEMYEFPCTPISLNEFCSDFEMRPVDEIMIGIILAVFCCRSARVMYFVSIFLLKIIYIWG